MNAVKTALYLPFLLELQSNSKAVLKLFQLYQDMYGWVINEQTSKPGPSFKRPGLEVVIR
jgi:hypothetical protein